MTSKSRPAVILSPSEEGDADALGRVHLGSMEGDWVYERRFPKARRPDWEQRISDWIYKRSTQPASPSYRHELKATLASDPSVIVGTVIWDLSPDRTATLGHPSAKEQAEAAAKPKVEKSERTKAIEGQMDREFLMECERVLGETRRELLGGREHWYLGRLAVDPAYQGLGVASAMLNYGLSRADAAGLPCYLEASPKGQPVYAAKGFEVVRTLRFADENAEGGVIVVPAMLRPARKTTAPQEGEVGAATA